MPSSLTVGYDATAAVRQTAGIGRYARELLRALSLLPSQDRYRVTYASVGASIELPQLGPRFRTYLIPASDRVLHAIWNRARIPLPIEMRTGSLDVFHSPDFSLAASLAPSIVTVHDLAFEVVPQLGYPTLARYLHRAVPAGVRRARAVIVPSANTKQAVIRRFGTDPSKIHVIPEAASDVFKPEGVDQDHEVLGRLGVHPPFLLSVSTLEPRKNYQRLLEAFAALRARGRDVRQVIVGRPGWLYGPIFERWRELKLEGAALFLSSVGDEDLAALYRQAELTVYPSIYEGFGLPALEALASGSPLACSGNSSLPEVTGDAGVFFDPWDVEDMTETIDALLLDPNRRHELAARGPIQAQKFSWFRAATETNALYHHVAAR